MSDNPIDKDTTLAPLTLDPDEYRDDLANFDLTETQQNELLQTLWNIMSMMVDIGWGVDSVQLVLPELFTEVAPEFDKHSEKLLESSDAQKFNQSARNAERENHD